MTSNRPWLIAHAEYQGFPIYFRRPDVQVAETAKLRPMYPRLLAITHVLKHVKKSGLPESRYNDSLESFDSRLLSPFDNEADGLVVLIETFAGKRTYYIYVTSLFNAEAFICHVKSEFPSEELTYEVEEDLAWRLFQGYAADFGFA